jgi:hypothetical protein
MPTNEKTVNGAVVEREIIDLAANRYQLFRDSGSGLVLVDDRVLTPDETATLTAEQNERTVEDRLREALAANKVFLANASPTNAQTLAQVKSLTRQVSGLIRKLASDYREAE